MKQAWFFTLATVVLTMACIPAPDNASQGNASQRNPFYPSSLPSMTENTAESPSNNVSLTAAMTDAEILAYFNLDIQTAAAERVQGKDGVQMTYVLGEARVSVVRSQVSGLAVVAEGTNPAGAWSLGEAE
jgi:hypothetical protein